MARKKTPTALPEEQQPEFVTALAELPTRAYPVVLEQLAAEARELYNDAIRANVPAQVEAASVQYRTVVYRLNGDTWQGCRTERGAESRLEGLLAAPAGSVPGWGQAGQWLLEVDGLRIRAEIKPFGLGVHYLGLHAVDAAAPFLSESGYLSCRLDPRRWIGHELPQAVRAEVSRQIRGNCKLVPIGEGYRQNAITIPAWLAPVLEGVTRNGQQSLALSGRPAAGDLVAVVEKKAPLDNKERQRLFRQRQKERKAQAEAEGLLTLQLSPRDRLYLASALDYYDFQQPYAGEFVKGNLLELYQRLKPPYRDPQAWPQDEERDAWVARQMWHTICDAAQRKQEKAEADLVEARGEIARLQALLGAITGELGIALPSTNQQIDKSTEDRLAAVVEVEAFSLQLLRRHKWKGGREEDVALVAVQVVPHDGQWMWAATLSSQNGSGYSYAPLPKWGRFAPTPGAALQQGLAEVREYRARVTSAERKRLDAWLAGEAAERLAQLGVAVDSDSNKSTNQQMLIM